MTENIRLTIDGREVTVPKGTTVYTATKQLGIDIPIFCYQDRMPPFGACRVCLVEVEKMNKLQTSCTLEVSDGMVVHTQAEQAVKARKEILEFLLINHPLDCPICDKGGECPLQDQVFKFGPGESRFFEEKRHFEKPLFLGPLLALDRERCIACARCTRFGDIIAGDNALEFLDRGFKIEVGTADDGPPKSKFIGNTIMICPVGALTSEVYRFRARPWDNDTVDSTCTLCPVGCSMKLDSRDGEIVRSRSNENRDVNDIWLCDKGWFGYEFSSNPKRLTQPLLRRHGELLPVSWEEAFSFIAMKMKEAKPNNKIAAFGGNNLTVEENYLLQQLMRDALHCPNVDHRIGMPLFTADQEGMQAGMQIAIGELHSVSHVLILGCDITEEFPIIWLQLKEAINKGAKVHFIGHFAPECSRYFEKTTLITPGTEIAAIEKYVLEHPGQTTILIGRQFLATENRKAILSLLQKSVPHLSLNLLEGQENSCGARYAGMHPEFGPQGKKLPNAGLDALSVLKAACDTGWDLLYAVGADIAAKVPTELWAKVRKNLGCLIVQDLFLTETALVADVVLPALSFVEKGGSFMNIEGRIQKLKPAKAITKGVYSDSYLFVKIAQRLGKTLLIDEEFLQQLLPGSIHKASQSMSPTTPTAPPTAHEKLVATFAPELFDSGVRMQHNSHLSELVKEPTIRIHPDVAKKRGFSDHQSVTIDTLSAKLQYDTGVAPQTVVLPLNLKGFKTAELGENLLNGLSVTIN